MERTAQNNGFRLFLLPDTTMPEGPSLVILREQAAAFAGKTIARVEGNTSIDKERLVGQRIVSLRTWENTS